MRHNSNEKIGTNTLSKFSSISELSKTKPTLHLKSKSWIDARTLLETKERKTISVNQDSLSIFNDHSAREH